MLWTETQREAIEARGGNLLISAAAGSGKTAVLAARILSLIEEGTRVDELLVVTFTKAAAAEMRGRILTMLHDAAREGDSRLAQEAMRVEWADICTLHSFCAKVCRDHFQAAGVDPSFRVGDAAEVAVLSAQAMEEALIACFESPSPAFAHAAACLTRKELMEAAEGLRAFLMARQDPWEWLTQVEEAYALDEESLRDSPWMAVLLEKVRLEAAVAVDLYERVLEFSRERGLYLELTLDDVKQAEAFSRAAQMGYGSLEGFSLAFGRKPNKAKDVDLAAEEEYGTLRKTARKALEDAHKHAGEIGALLANREELQSAGLMLTGLGEGAKMFDKCFLRLKEEKNLLDFSDLEHFTLRALRCPAVALTLRNNYKYIFIDEYQDASQLQEAIIGTIRRENNLFMVGDVKQSIYRFRLAEPGLFLGKLTRFSPEPNAVDRRIDLNTNYRSHKKLLECINSVFEQVFCGGAMEIVYDEMARLRAGTETNWAGAPVELHLIDPKSGETPSTAEDDDAATAEELTPEAREAIQWEAEVIAERIAALRDAPEGGYALKDMAILMRTVKGKAVQVAEVLRSHGIHAWTDLGENALSRTEVQAMLAMLRVVDNLRQDVPLLAALRGPALGLTDEALAEIRAAHPEETFAEAMLSYARLENALAEALRGFIQRVRDWGLDAQVLPLDALLRRLYHDTGYYAQIGAMPGGASRQANLRMLAEHAAAYQRSQAGGLSGFLRYLDRVQEHEGLAAAELTESDDVVRILSIHKSKGLQFPVVFVAGMGSGFRLRDNTLLQVHAELGAALPAINPELRTKWTTLIREAIVEKREREARAEEARVLYVAMTRAERRLILVGTQRKGDEDRWRRLQGPALAATGRKQLDWVAPCALSSPDWVVLTHRHDQQAHAAQAGAALASIAEQVRAHTPQGNAVTRALGWKRPVLPDRPLKQSVSAILRAEAKRGEEEGEVPALESLSRRPLFMEERGLTAAERGDAIHMFLRNLSLDAQDLAAACRSMVSQGILSQRQALSLPLDLLNLCVHSELWTRMAASEELHREWAFNQRVWVQGRRTLLQGVIDACFLEENAWVLVDYKTGSVLDTATLLERYKPQISMYTEALERITGKRVKERVLYLIEMGEGYSL